MRAIIFPYKMGSQSAKAIAKELGATRVYPNRRYKPRLDDLVINWGNSVAPNWGVNNIKLNKPENVKIACNKLSALTRMKSSGVAVPEFTTEVREAYNWLQEGHKVVARTILTGSQGNGIVICNDKLVHAPLYTKLIDSTGEYRVHVFNGEVIDYAKKSRKREDTPDFLQDKIRSHKNGWLFRRGNLRRLERIEQLAVRAVQSLGLDFGAVDIIKDQNGDVFVLEVNTACGLEGQTLISYVNAIKNYANRW